MFGLKLEIWMSWSEEHIPEFDISISEKKIKEQ